MKSSAGGSAFRTGKGCLWTDSVQTLDEAEEAMLMETSRMNLAYAPPFSPVWDTLLIATNLLKL
jgi:hypothetical protein